MKHSSIVCVVYVAAQNINNNVVFSRVYYLDIKPFAPKYSIHFIGNFGGRHVVSNKSLF